MDWKTLFFSAEGRIGRSAFWIGWLVLLGVNVVASWIPLIGLLISLASIYCSVCVYSKRLHDMGKSGWLQIWPILICTVLIVGAIVMVAGPAVMAGISNADESAIMAAVMAGVGGMILAFLLAFLIWFGFLLWVGLSSGNPGDNKYGPAPATPAVA
ncbi:MAG: DUF805 domain-containing protein [Caulobacter sp.]|nr:DUF805 domain-containing protein [Caulobacter sp.]